MKLRIKNIGNHLSTRKLKQVEADHSYTAVIRAKARKLLLLRGETITL